MNRDNPHDYIPKCEDHGKACPAQISEKLALQCWLIEMTKGYCPYLREEHAIRNGRQAR